MVAFVGFKQTAVQYRRDARFADKGKYNRFTGSLTIGLNGLICFSSKPLKIMCGMGFGFAVFGALLGLFWLVQRFLFASPIEGFLLCSSRACRCSSRDCWANTSAASTTR
ncbi:MAG: hypothetical protein Q4B42_05870, partial [Oscillospiraceae bacterium]|nr:hypothetical protein [Oscillospiraceae bacterium]